MNRIKRIRSTLMAASLALVLIASLSSSATAETYRLRIGSAHPAQASLWVKLFKHYYSKNVQEKVAAHTPHRIKWTEAYGGIIAKAGEVLEAVEGGTLDVGYIVVPFEPAKLPLHSYGFNVFFSSSDMQQVVRVVQKLWDRYPWMAEFLEKRYNQKVITPTVTSSYQILSTFPIRTIEDMKGQKFGAAGPNMALYPPIGAVPVQTALPEVYTSVQTGLYGGVTIFPGPMMGFKLYEVAKYLTLVDLGALSAGLVTINLDRWNTLPKEIQQIIMETGREYMNELGVQGTENHKRSIAGLQSKGVKVYTLPFEEKKKWANALPNVADKAAKEADSKGMPGSEVYRFYIDTMEAEGYVFPRKWEIR